MNDGNEGLDPVDAYRASLTSFLIANEAAKIAQKTTQTSEIEYWIEEPWQDKTLGIKIPHTNKDEAVALTEALNCLHLPPRYSAVKHAATGLLEVIWTAYKLQPTSKEVDRREFLFSFEDRERRCYFGETTATLLTLAKHCYPVSIPNHTDHRNIVSLHFFANGIERPNLDKPVSFFVETDGLDDTQLLELIKHLNAYMSYFDHSTPRVLIHDVIGPSEHPTRHRYRNNSFPGSIKISRLDPNILAYWNEMCATRSEIMRFLLCYRIIEYAAFNYIEATTRAKIRRILSSPDISGRLDTVIAAVAEQMSMNKDLADIPRAQNLVAATADMECVWGEIEKNRAYFAEDTCFEGGFSVKALITSKETFDIWSNNGVRNTLDRMRAIRNALSHGQDGQTRGTILPTATNARKIRPWLNLIEILAGDAMLYRDMV